MLNLYLVPRGRKSSRPEEDAVTAAIEYLTDAGIIGLGETHRMGGGPDSDAAARLREAGFAHVENLRGSIFEWANEGRPVVRDGREVEAVHPYDAVWGRLLAPERRADLP